MNLTFPLLLVVGLAFGGGVLAGSAAFSAALRQREYRLSTKAKAVDAARRYLLRYGIELPAWVVGVVEDEQLTEVDRPTRQYPRLRWLRWSK